MFVFVSIILVMVLLVCCMSIRFLVNMFMLVLVKMILCSWVNMVKFMLIVVWLIFLFLSVFYGLF